MNDTNPADGPLPELVFGYVSVTSQGGQSVFESSTTRSGSTEAYHARPEDLREAYRALEDHGLQLLASSPIGIGVVGPPDAFAALTRGRLVRRELLLYADQSGRRNVTHLDIVGDNQPSALGLGRVAQPAARIEGVLLERPRFPLVVAPSPNPPASGRFHLQLPDDVARVLGATAAHAAGYVGQDISVAMIDTGHFAHSFFHAHAYAVQPPQTMVPATDPALDPVGHGTGESANLFAVAPGVRLRPYRASNDRGKLVATMSALLRAKADGPAIMSNSWGGDTDPNSPPDAADLALAIELQHAVETGIVVVFSAGNGQFSIEPQVPGVLAAGGVYADVDGSLRASDFASAYQSPWYPGVNVPDLCGIIGLQPRAQYLMLPVPPGSPIDMEASAPQVDDPADGTTADDGWALFSGTSAAAPQLAGAAALLLDAKAGLSVRQVTEALTETGVDVTTGRSHPRFNAEATQGRDVATGCGLVHAWNAVRYALDHF